jgi:hypothetical protein
MLPVTGVESLGPGALDDSRRISSTVRRISYDTVIPVVVVSIERSFLGLAVPYNPISSSSTTLLLLGSSILARRNQPRSLRALGEAPSVSSLRSWDIGRGPPVISVVTVLGPSIPGKRLRSANSNGVLRVLRRISLRPFIESFPGGE